MNNLVLTNQSGKDVTTSLIVAEVFGKEHKNVLRDIETLSCSDSFNRLNFELIKYFDSRGREQKAYEITKDGFSFLVMGYTGEKAGEFKEKFIREFNKREALLKDDDYIIHRAFNLLTERSKMLEQQLEQKEQQLQLQQKELQEAAPKVQFYEEALQTKDLITASQVAADLGVSAIKLNMWLFEQQFQHKAGGVWIPSAKIKGLGYMKSRIHTYYDSKGEMHSTQHFYFTQAGREFVMRKWKAYHKYQEVMP
jgi:Rha family phage regulatory protein